MTDAECDALRAGLGERCYVVVRKLQPVAGLPLDTTRTYMHGDGKGYTWTCLPCEASRKTRQQARDCQTEATTRHACSAWLLNLSLLPDEELALFFERLQVQMRRMA